MNRRILHVVTNVAHYDDPGHRTGLWWSELTHAYDLFAGQGHEQHLVSPRGGHSPLEPRSLKWRALYESAKAVREAPSGMALLENALAPDNVARASRKSPGTSMSRAESSRRSATAIAACSIPG